MDSISKSISPWLLRLCIYFAMIEILAATVVAQTNRLFFFFCFCEAHGLVTNAYGTMEGGR